MVSIILKKNVRLLQAASLCFAFILLCSWTESCFSRDLAAKGWRPFVLKVTHLFIYSLFF